MELSEETENVYSVLYTLYSVAYTYSDINVSDKGKDAMMKASKLLDHYYSKKDKNEA